MKYDGIAEVTEYIKVMWVRT